MPGRRLALLVATYRYQDVGLRQLTAPGHDAEALAEVLRDPQIADFDVTTLINEPHHVVGDAIGEFYHNRRHGDLTLLYFTGHGLKDDQGRLYLAMTDTKRDRLLFSALSAQQIDDAMESCWSRQKILVLDCCYSGAFPADRISKADPQVHTLEKFQGKGRVVLTASDSTQYSFEGNHIIGEGSQSVFTRFLVEGLPLAKPTSTTTVISRLMSCTATYTTALSRRCPSNDLRNKKTLRDASSSPETYIGACPSTFAMQLKARSCNTGWPFWKASPTYTALATTSSEPKSSARLAV